MDNVQDENIQVLSETNNKAIQNTTLPHLSKMIGNTTYEVYIHFSETSKESLIDKINRLIQNDVMDFM